MRFNCKTGPPVKHPVDLVAGLAPTDVLPEPARKKRRLGLAATHVAECVPESTIERQQLQPVPTIFLDNSEVPASSSSALEVSPLFATSEVFKRYQARAAKRALESAVQIPDESDNIARQLEASSKKRRKMVKRIATDLEP